MLTPSPEERALNSALLDQPAEFGYRFTHAADCELRRILFRSLAGQRDDYLRLFFPQGPPFDYSEPWSLRKAQGALDGAEYTAAAKGTACGHIFKSGESTYHCKTCALDDTCVLCARCFDASDHEGHQVFVSVSPGNSGCCDCGDREAWKHEVPCTIHTADAVPPKQQSSGKEKASAGEPGAGLPIDLVESIRMTIARAVDYLCDVFSCSPEQMRLPKTETGIKLDELHSRLSGVYGEESIPDEVEYALILWNDEKHTVFDVQNQVARACSKTKKFGFQKAMEVNDVGRSVVQFSTDLKELLRMAEIIEQLKVTVTIRTSRDTFREHMCEAIIDWIGDISGCSVGNDPHILRNIVCEELLKPWRTGSQASNKDIGLKGLDDHETEDNDKLRKKYRNFFRPFQPGVVIRPVEPEVENNLDDEDDEDDYDEDEEDDLMETEEDGMEIELSDIRAAANAALAASVADVDMDMDFMDENDGAAEALEATFAGYPPPPPPPPPAAGSRRRIFTPTESDDGEAEPAVLNSNEPYGKIPRTPKIRGQVKKPQRPSKHWLEKPDGFRDQRPNEPCEDLWQRVRLDFLILYDLRLWKILRIHLRHLYITTVVTIPHFKRILGLRFAGLYTALAQLYLIADREPDHSIINLSVQMLTTPTITQEVVERGNFLSNLMAILYSFLTTRQVGFPEDVSPRATLAFDAGAVANRRMFHFFLDLRWLFQSEFIIHRMRMEQRYLLQFLDLVKLHQGVCPNVRATGEHVEYESDAWISASLIVKEINKLCKQIGLSFEPKPAVFGDDAPLRRAIRTVSQITLINSYGCERKRFHTAEVKNMLEWHDVGPFDQEGRVYSVPKGVVQTEPMSFHHPLHYLLSWLIENAKNISPEEMRSMLQFSRDDLKDPWNVSRHQQHFSGHVTSDDLLSAMFDHPLRVCVWLAQMKAGMWVRNGITLRHQAHTYRSVSHRDVGYQRDILMVQTGFVLSGSQSERPGERFLAQVIDRFQMENWVKGDYSVQPGFDETQQIDVFEDFYHLLVIVLSERGNLAPSSDSKEQLDRQLQHDIAHALCFKPLSFSDLSSRVTEKISESDDFNRILESMTNYRPPEGLSDTGTFELRPEFIELVNPYYAHYSRNHREEAESIYKKHIVRKTGKKFEDVVYDPKLQPISSGLFANLSAFTSTPLFARVIGAALNFAEDARHHSTKLQTTRIETFLHTVLHLVVIATTEDEGHRDGFVKFAASPYEFSSKPGNRSVVSSLVALSGMDQYASCHPTIRYILRKMQLRLPEKVDTIMGRLAFIFDRTENNSPASISSEDKERKKQEALARQARVMAQMKQQQNSFLQNQGLSGFEDDFDDLDDMSITDEPESIEHRKTWSFPTGTCIWCQEETDDQRLYGTFAFLGESNILRATPVDDVDFVREVIETPESLDRPADEIRPFGVAGDNRRIMKKFIPGGKVVESERQELSKGFPHREHGSINGPVATSCGHIMHFSCFELYMENSRRRHQQQIARNHPENPLMNEFTCPLCKALGNTFLPIIWKGKECAHEHELHAAKSFGDWLLDAQTDHLAVVARRKEAPTVHGQQQAQAFTTRSSAYVNSMFAPSLVASMNDLSLEVSSSTSSPQPRYSLRRGPSLSRFFSWHRNEGSQSSIDTTTLSSSGDQVPRMAELMKAYYRVDETLSKNQLMPSVEYSEYLGSQTDPIGPLSTSLGLSISAFEIAHRGVGHDVLATSLLADLNEQTLTHLRVLSETIESYLAVSVFRPSVPSILAQKIVAKRDSLTLQLFGISGEDFEGVVREPLPSASLLETDSFLFFVHWLTYTAPSVAEASSAMKLCYWAEIVKAGIVYSKALEGSSPEISTMASWKPSTWDFKVAMAAVLERPDAIHDEEAAAVRHLVNKYALAFLRKCIVAMYVRYGLDFECPYNINPESPELERLTALLHLPSIDEICTLYISQSEAGNLLQKITRGWISLSMYPREDNPREDSLSPRVTVPHPAIFELVGLPKNYDTLTEEAIKRKCPTTGKELTDPAVCLFCGEIFCSQAVCCMKDKNKGGCYQHMSKCGGKVGLFINIRKCMVLFMHGDANGSYSHAPYLDKHGEPDPTLRRHHQLFLNQRRYDKLIRDAWLAHLVPTVISRKLEADINPGGWETL